MVGGDVGDVGYFILFNEDHNLDNHVIVMGCHLNLGSCGFIWFHRSSGIIMGY
jgi:hypothetical protein